MKKRLNVHLYVIPNCNLDCIHCYYQAKDTKFKFEKLLSIDKLRFIIMHLVDNYDAYFDIEGGELFLRKDIHELFSSLENEYLNRLTITTNGTINFDYTYSYLQQLDELRISFEGHTDDLQQSIRNIPLKKPLYTAKQLLKRHVPVVIRITLHKQNFLYIKEMIEFFKNHGFLKFSLYEYQSSGRGKKREQ